MKYLLFLMLACFFAVPNAYAGDPAANRPKMELNSHEQKMVSKKWLTSKAIDQNNMTVPAADGRVAVFFGLAEYYPDHKFNMTTPDGKPKMHGLWNMSDDGRTRTLIVQNDEGQTRFTRVVENVKISDDEYTYRIYPNEGNKLEYIDIVHIPQ